MTDQVNSEKDRKGAPGAAGAAQGAPEHPRVLVVDDDQVDRITVRRHLARSGLNADIVEAEGVLEAIGKLTTEHFDCVLLDFNLSDGDGLTFLRGLRNAGVSVPVIMLTGQADPNIAVSLMLAGAADYIPKDALSARRLRETVGAVLHAHRAQ